MFSQTADLYDAIYSTLKNYEDEADRIAELIRKKHDEARSILDVACGTGEHARFLHEKHGYIVDGIDLEPDFVRIAGDKNPDGRFTEADMTDFELDRRYDVVLCLFSSIAYVKTRKNVARTLVRFRAHLNEGGLIIVEPWLLPEVFDVGRVDVVTVEIEGTKITRMSHCSKEDRLSVIQFDYLIGSPDGILHRTERHEAGLFTVDEMKSCFEEAGLPPEHEPEGIFGRGIYTARVSV